MIEIDIKAVAGVESHKEVPVASVGIGLGLGLRRDLDGTGRDLDNKILMSGTCPKIIYKNKFQILYRLIRNPSMNQTKLRKLLYKI